MKRKTGISRPSLPMYERIRQILDSARSSAARSVNTTQVVANWLIGREIVEEEQKGKRRAEYGKKLIESLAVSIAKDYGAGYSVQSLFYMKQFYLSYPELCSGAPILHAVRGESSRGLPSRKLHAVRGEWSDTVSMPLAVIPHAASTKSWKPGLLHPNLSWTLSAPTKMGGAK